MTLGEILDRYPVALNLLRCVGVRYYYGRGTPRTPWDRIRDTGVDCSGFLQMSWVRLGIYRWSEPDRRATTSTPTLKSIADICIATAQPQFGDVAIYPNHVMFVLGGEWVIGASGGDSKTFGDNPKACVALHRFDYRKDFLTFGTLGPDHRLATLIPGANP